METKQLILGIATAVFVFGAYFIGLFQSLRNPVQWREIFRSLFRPLTWRGFVWSVALPASWVLLYYVFIARVWLLLGRWPRFNERIERQWLSIHDEALRYLFGALVGSLYVIPAFLFICLFLRRWRHVSIYVLCYGAAVGVASCALFLAPRPFLNWFFD